MHICNNYIYYTLLTSLPTYFATILNFNLHEVREVFLSLSLWLIDKRFLSRLGIQNGFIFALPYLAQLISTLIVGRIVDQLRTRKTFSITVLRKGQTVIGRTDVRTRNELDSCLEFSLRYGWYLRMSGGHRLHEM